MMKLLKQKRGMEMVQVAILVAIAVALGIIFKSQITAFVNEVFSKLDAASSDHERDSEKSPGK